MVSVDSPAALFINHLQLPGLDVFSSLISSGYFLTIIAFAICMAIISYEKERKGLVVGALLFALLLNLLVTQLLFKAALIPVLGYRERPYLAHQEIVVRGAAAYTDSSFPSAHVAGVAAVMTVLLVFYRKRLRWLWPVAILAALLMAFSRLHNGVHYPTDVAAGALLGVVLGGMAVKIAEWMNVYYPSIIFLKEKIRSRL
jgi:undecaprenyl-diphosphatase